MKEATIHAGARIHLLGTISGFVPDAGRVQDALAAGPDAIGLGIPPEDLHNVAKLHDVPDTELPELDPQTERLFAHLAPFGRTEVPSPDLQAAYAYARTRDVPLRALDLDDEEHSSVYVKTVGFRQAVKSGKLLKRVLKARFDQDDPYELAIAWDAFQTDLPSLQAVERAREAHMAKELATLAEGRDLVVAVVPIARLAGVVAALRPNPS